MMAEPVDMAGRRRRSRRRRAPHTTLERMSLKRLPGTLHRFLFGRPQEFPAVRCLAGALFGAACGLCFSLGFGHNLPLSLCQRAAAACLFVAACAAGGALSSHFRCSLLLAAPCMLGSQGRAYVMLLLFSGLASGPVSNIQRNMQAVSLTLGCNIDLQINHTKTMWREVMRPFRLVLQDIVDSSAAFRRNVAEVTGTFRNLTDELMAQHGYDPLGASQSAAAAPVSTQDKFAANTMMQCDNVVGLGIGRCRDWFKVKHADCMDTISVPVINDVLCVSMKFDFLCDVMKVMIPWCREQIPVEGNFGNTYDKLNQSIEQLADEFHTEVSIGEEEVVGDVLEENFTDGLKREFQEIQTVTDWLFQVLQVLTSLTFVTVYVSAFLYARRYNRDVQFDNVYVTTYFRRIDARRKRAGRSYLLPLRNAERGQFIVPDSVSVHPMELRLILGGLLQVLAIGVAVAVLLGADRALYHALGVVERNTFTQFNLSSVQDIRIQVHNDSMMARLLKSTVGAFNSSHRVDVESSNARCLPRAVGLTPAEYARSTLPLPLLALMWLAQAYGNRLRRVVAAAFFPKREKTRVLFLYNLHVHRRRAYAARLRRRVAAAGHGPPWPGGALLRGLAERLGGWRLEWCYGCGERQRCAGTREALGCPTAGCPALYCPQCWSVLEELCALCGPGHNEDG